VRFAGDDDTRFSEMTAFADILDRDETMAVATYVKSLSEGGDLTGPGAELYADNCASCHGETARGEPALGAPDLTDAIWLYGSDVADIAAQIRAPKHGVMPAWQARLGETTVKELAVYVHSLGGGQ